VLHTNHHMLHRLCQAKQWCSIFQFSFTLTHQASGCVVWYTIVYITWGTRPATAAIKYTEVLARISCYIKNTDMGLWDDTRGPNIIFSDLVNARRYLNKMRECENIIVRDFDRLIKQGDYCLVFVRCTLSQVDCQNMYFRERKIPEGS